MLSSKLVAMTALPATVPAVAEPAIARTAARRAAKPVDPER